MNRCAVFVDAGFALVAGNYICTGRQSRTAMNCRHEPFIRALAGHASNDCGFPVMRTYWYDAAPDSGPTRQHKEIARLRDVKLRLGRLSGGRQKGVDALVYKDLITLAQERAIVTAYLVSGDYDLREGVVAAQDLGVQVYLLGFETGNPSVATLAPALVREVDGFEEFGQSFIEPYFTEKEEGAEAPSPEEFGRDFAFSWVEEAEDEDVRRVVESAPRIPSDVDGHMLSEAEQALGDLRDRESARRELRSGFWTAMKEMQSEPLGSESGRSR